MDYKYIEQLLDRYFQGETTLQEEQILKSFYAQGDKEMPQEIGQYAPLFCVMNEQETLGEDFDEQMIRMTEGTTRVKARTVSMTERLRPLFRAAAMVAILLTLGGAISQSLRDNSTWVDMDDYSNKALEAVSGEEQDAPTVAYDQMKDSLTLAKDELQTIITDSLLNSSLD